MSDKLKTASILVLVALVLLAPAIRDAISEESAKYVNDSESAHDGLPSEWIDEKSFACYSQTISLTRYTRLE